MSKTFFQNVLVLSPHTDDGELAAGGTIARFVQEGSNVTYVALSAPRPELHEECKKCLEVLGGYSRKNVRRFSSTSTTITLRTMLIWCSLPPLRTFIRTIRRSLEKR